VEVLPPLLPARLDLRDLDAAEGGGEALFRLGSAVRRELEPVLVLPLLETLREEHEHRRAGLLPPFDWDADGEPPKGASVQRNAVRSFSKKPSSGL
jgi:hypothetical protein